MAKLQIRNGTNGGGVEVGDLSLTTDESVVLYAASYDSDDNYLGDVSVAWSSTGTLDQVDGDKSSYTFAPSSAPSSGTIVVAKSGVSSDATGTISVSVGISSSGGLVAPLQMEFIASILENSTA